MNKIFLILKKILLSPYTIILGMIIGAVIGINSKATTEFIRPLGDIYMSLLMMCVIPIMFAAVVTSIGKAVRSTEAQGYLKNLIAMFILFMTIISLTGVIVGILSKPIMGINESTKKAIGNLLIENNQKKEIEQEAKFIREIDSEHHNVKHETGFIVEFVLKIIPTNIFKALSLGESLKIIFFAVLLGFMMKFVSESACEAIIHVLEGIFEVFQKTIKGSMYFLPFGLISLMASQFSKVGPGIIMSFLGYIIVFIIMFTIVMIVSSLIIWRKSGKSYFFQFHALKETIMVAIGTRNSYAVITTALSDLRQFGFDRDKINLSYPLSIALCRTGNLSIFSFTAIFAAYLYDVKLDLKILVVIFITSIFAAIATSGAPGIVARTLMAIVLSAIDIPSEAIVAMLIALDPILSPLSTLIVSYTGCAVTALISSKEKIKIAGGIKT